MHFHCLWHRLSQPFHAYCSPLPEGRALISTDSSLICLLNLWIHVRVQLDLYAINKEEAQTNYRCPFAEPVPGYCTLSILWEISSENEAVPIYLAAALFCLEELVNNRVEVPQWLSADETSKDSAGLSTRDRLADGEEKYMITVWEPWLPAAPLCPPVSAAAVCVIHVKQLSFRFSHLTSPHLQDGKGKQKRTVTHITLHVLRSPVISTHSDMSVYTHSVMLTNSTGLIEDTTSSGW